jgi:hypothetical protein
MTEREKEGKRRPAPINSLVKKAKLNIILFLLAAVLIGSGFYLSSHSELIVRNDIRKFNEGVADYHVPPSKEPGGPPLFSTKALPSVYPIERVRVHFEKACAETTDKRLKSMAFYNLGTMVGRLAFDERLLSVQRIEMAEAISKLAEALRNDPNNEDAKFNKELLDRVQTREGKEKGAPGPGYIPGVVQKGF